MDYARSVGRSQCIRDVGCKLQHFRQREAWAVRNRPTCPARLGTCRFRRPEGKPTGEGRTLEILHDQEINSSVMSNVEKRTNIRMRQSSYRARLSLEPGAAVRIGSVLGWQDLESYDAAKAGVLGLVTSPIPPAPKAPGPYTAPVWYRPAKPFGRGTV